MSTKKLIIVLVVLFLTGSGIGYFAFSGFTELLLSKPSGEYTLVVTKPNEVFVTQVSFTVLIALAFVSVLISALVSTRFSSANLHVRSLLIFAVILVVSVLGAIFYYQNYFADLYTALDSGSGVSIQMDNIPYYRIPLLSAGITLVAGVIYSGISSFKSD